jgi:hypothetical protein
MTYKRWLWRAGGFVFGATMVLLLYPWHSRNCRVTFDPQGNAHISHPLFSGGECRLSRKRYAATIDKFATGHGIVFEDGGVIEVSEK